MKKGFSILLFVCGSIPCAFSMATSQDYEYFASPAPSIMSYLPVILILAYVFIGLYVRYDNKKLRGTESVFQYKHNKGNAYVEYRQWKLLWGLMIDSQKEVNKVIDEWNDNGYTCIGFQRSFMPNVSIAKILLILIITVLTLGFVNFYSGPTLLFVLSKSKKVSLDDKPHWERNDDD